MNISNKEQYAIKAMLNLAINYNNRAVKLSDLKNSSNISLSYLEQLFSHLNKSGLVNGVRGPGGGYRLSKSPDRISIAEIIRSVESPSKNKDLKNNFDCKNDKKYLATRLSNEVSKQITDYLDSITLAELIKDKIVVKTQYKLDETTRRISTMFPVSEKIRVA